MHATRQSSIAAGILVIGVATAQAQAIRVGENVAVTDGMDRRPPVEPHLAIHPTTSRHLLGAAITTVVAEAGKEMLSRQSCSSFVSRDDGRSPVLLAPHSLRSIVPGAGSCSRYSQTQASLRPRGPTNCSDHVDGISLSNREHS